VIIDVSYIIVNWNTRALCAQAVASIQSHEAGSDHEIIVVDNGSTDGSAAYLRERFPGITLIANPDNVGFARANNQGAEAAQGEWLILFNSDAYQTGPILGPLLKVARSIGPCVFACRLLYPDGTPQLSASAFPSLAGYLRESLFHTSASHGRQLAALDSLPLEAGRVDWVTAAFLMTPRERYMALGGLDASIFMYAEDVDFCRKAAAQGMHSYITRLVSVVHMGGGSVNHLSARALRLTDQGRLIYFRRWHGAFAALLLRGIFLFRSVTRTILFAASGAVTGNATLKSKAGVHLRGAGFLLGVGQGGGDGKKA
jgi:GT2 family glycosyltransferase